MKIITLLTISITILFSSSHSFGAKKYQLADKSDIAKLIEVVGSQSASNAWHFSNLYDLSSDSFFKSKVIYACQAFFMAYKVL